MGGRSLLNAPLAVLLEQLGEHRAFFGLEIPAAALAAAGIDPIELVAEVDQTLADGWAASGAVFDAHLACDEVTADREAWRAAFVAWVQLVRVRLDALGRSREASDVRKRIGRHPGSSFARARERLELTLTALRTYAQVLEIHTWPHDPFAPAERLIRQARELEEANEQALANRKACVAAAVVMRKQAQNRIRQVRLQWKLAGVSSPTRLPDLPHSVLEQYASARRESATAREAHAPAVGSESEALPGECEALPGECEALPGESEALPGECEALPGESEALPGESEALPGEFVGCQGGGR